MLSFLTQFFFQHSRYYSDEWLHEDPNRVPPHKDDEISLERNKCFKRFFDDIVEYDKVMMTFAQFSLNDGPFSNYDSI